MSQSGSGRCVSMRSTHLQLLSFGVALLVLATLISPSGAFGATYSFTPVADGSTRSDASTTSYGTASRNYVRSSSSQIRNTYMRFNVAFHGDPRLRRVLARIAQSAH